jgi:Tol biopolymer transport system component
VNLSWFRDGTKWVVSGVGPGDDPQSEKAGIWTVSMFGGTPRQLRADADGAVVSPDDRRIAFRTTKGNPEIWVMDADGGGARQLTTAAPREHFGKLQWSGDGKFLAFMRYGTEPGKEIAIETREVDGNRISTVLADPGLRAFCWAPDGRIIFSRRAAPGSNEMNLWELPVKANGRASGAAQQITHWAGFAFSDMNVTADSKRLIFIKEAHQTNVFVASDKETGSPQSPVRMTLDEWRDLPSGWTPDGKGVLFASDRNGNWSLFEQRLGSSDAEQLASAPKDLLEPRPSPDGALILFWSREAGARTAKLMRMPMLGGAAEPVLEASAGARFRCSARTLCLLGEIAEDGKRWVFTLFDPRRGRLRSLAPVEASATSEWDISPDGASIALLDPEDSSRLRLIDVNGGTRYLPLHAEVPAASVAWMPDGHGVILGSASVRGSALLRADLSGNVRQLWSGKSLAVSAPVPSPDGIHIAFAGSTARTNVWLIENF